MNLACFVTTPMNKSLHMDPHVSRLARVTYVTWDVPLREHRAASRRYGERDVHAAKLANPCLVCGMHSYGKGKDKPGVARRARS